MNKCYQLKLLFALPMCLYVLDCQESKWEAASSVCALWETVEKCVSKDSKEVDEEGFPLWVVDRWAMGWSSVMQWRVQAH